MYDCTVQSFSFVMQDVTRTWLYLWPNTWVYPPESSRKTLVGACVASNLNLFTAHVEDHLNVPIVKQPLTLPYWIPAQSRGYLGFSTVTPPPPQIFLWNAITPKLFYLGLSNLVWGYKWGMALSLSFGGLGLQEIGQWRPLKGQNLGFWTHFGQVLKYKRADDPKYHIHNAYICPL